MSTVIEGSVSYKGSHANPAYNNPKFIATVVSQVEGKLERELTFMEITTISNFVRNIDPDYLLKMPYHRVLVGVTESLIKRFASYDCTPEIIDTHELLKQEIGVEGETNLVRSLVGQGPVKTQEERRKEKRAEMSGNNYLVEVSKVFGCSKGHHLQKLINPNALLRTKYIILDTRHRVLDSDGTKFFTWNHINDVSTHQGTVNTVGTIRDIVAIRVFPFRVPYTSTLDTSYNKVSMLIREFQAQSFIGHEKRKFHFMFNPVISGNSVFLEPGDDNDGYFRFGNPITHLHSITVDFGSPLEEVIFDTDRLQGYVSNYGTGLETEFTTAGAHKLLTGNVIYITEFLSLNNLATPIVSNSINRNTGYPVIVTSPSVFKIRLDSSSMTPLIEGGGAVTLSNSNVENLTPNNTTLATGDRIRVTDVASSPFTIDEVFNVLLYEPTIGKIHLDRNYGAVAGAVFVFKDYRLPPMTSTTAITTVNPVKGITVTGAIATGGKTFLNDYKVGDFISFVKTSPALSDGPHLVTSIQSDDTITTNRTAPGAITDMTAVKSTTLTNNVFSIYFGSKRMFIPIEITFISPDV
jgi:signal peptidase I